MRKLIVKFLFNALILLDKCDFIDINCSAEEKTLLEIPYSERELEISYLYKSIGGKLLIGWIKENIRLLNQSYLATVTRNLTKDEIDNIYKATRFQQYAYRSILYKLQIIKSRIDKRIEKETKSGGKDNG